MTVTLFHAIPPGDLAALALFCLLWLGYGPIVALLGGNTINAGLAPVRALWMQSSLKRDNRIVDAALIGHVIHSASFFASTSLIAVGGVLGLLTGLDRLQPALETLAVATPVSRTLLEIKLLLPAAVLVQGLFKLTWALRQLNYTVALIGAMPPVAAAGNAALADAVGGVLSSALVTFNTGIRGYYFALVGLTWLAGPMTMAVASLGLMAVLLHRQTFSGVSRRFLEARRLMEQAHRDAG